MKGRGPAPGTDRTRGVPGVAALLLASLLLAAPGCGSDDGGSSTATSAAAAGLTVTVEPAEAAPGDEIAARVNNDGDKTYTYGAAYELERRVGDAWRSVKLPPRPVIEIGYVASPGAAGPPVTVEVPEDAEPGPWRVVIDRDAPGVGLLSGEFEVVDG